MPLPVWRPKAILLLGDEEQFDRYLPAGIRERGVDLIETKAAATVARGGVIPAACDLVILIAAGTKPVTKDVKAACERHGKPLVILPRQKAGWGPLDALIKTLSEAPAPPPPPSAVAWPPKLAEVARIEPKKEEEKKEPDTLEEDLLTLAEQEKAEVQHELDVVRNALALERREHRQTKTEKARAIDRLEEVRAQLTKAEADIAEQKKEIARLQAGKPRVQAEEWQPPKSVPRPPTLPTPIPPPQAAKPSVANGAEGAIKELLKRGLLSPQEALEMLTKGAL